MELQLLLFLQLHVRSTFIEILLIHILRSPGGNGVGVGVGVQVAAGLGVGVGVQVAGGLGVGVTNTPSTKYSQFIGV